MTQAEKVQYKEYLRSNSKVMAVVFNAIIYKSFNKIKFNKQNCGHMKKKSYNSMKTLKHFLKNWNNQVKWFDIVEHKL